MYSLAQKHCTKFSNEKVWFFSVVNLSEIWHASTYGLYNYTYRVKKSAVDSMRPPVAARRGRSKRHLRALLYTSCTVEGRKESSRHAFYAL